MRYHLRSGASSSRLSDVRATNDGRVATLLRMVVSLAIVPAAMIWKCLRYRLAAIQWTVASLCDYQWPTRQLGSQFAAAYTLTSGCASAGYLGGAGNGIQWVGANACEAKNLN